MSLARRRGRERRSLLVDYMSRPLSNELDIIDKGDRLEVMSSTPEVAAWWLGTLRAMYPQDSYKDKGSSLEMHPEMGVTLKLNRLDGTLTVKGKKHLQWFKEHFDHMLDAGSSDTSVFKETTRLMDTYLRIADNMSVSEMLEHIPPSGAIRQGPTYIYRLWKGLLDQWLAGDGAVYIITPLIDAKRLADIFLILAKNKLSRARALLYTTMRCDGDQKYPKVFKHAKDMVKDLKNSNKKRLVVDERIRLALERFDTKFGTFHCKFIACVLPEYTEVLLTSASFHSMHFHFDHADMVLFMRMHSEDFLNNYLEPLGLAPRSDLSSGSAPLLSLNDDSTI